MSQKNILTLDFETDPFAYGHAVKPFAVGLYNGKDFTSIWNVKCPEMIAELLMHLPPSIIYMHNGGKFDIFFLMDWLDADLTIINGRITKGILCGRHEFRDSYSILPMSLKDLGGKKDIDIQKLSRANRNENRVEILEYLKQDCVSLHEHVTAFWSEFGDYLTIGSAAMAQLKKFHPFPRGSKSLDETFRSRFYFGGRVQCFQSGIIRKPFKIFDVRSMYPYVMKNFLHPVGTAYDLSTSITKNTAFLQVEGTNAGAFCERLKDGGIDFTVGYGTYFTTIHEFNAALETKTFRPQRVIKCFNFDDWGCFDGFVTHFFEARLKAIESGNRILKNFYKLILNSAYGKFAQNPDNFRDYCITHRKRLPLPWSEKHVYNLGEWIIWEKPAERHSYYNVAIGASITGAARSVLRNGLSNASDPMYCDTDSIICADLSNVSFGDELGDWQLEATGDKLAIAGKKLYACFDSGAVDENGNVLIGSDTCIKSATKGARIFPHEIEAVARGETVTYRRDAPTFKLDGSQQFVKREIRRTV